MNYELTKNWDAQKAREYLEKLIKDKSKCSLKKIHPKRSVSQNSYLHVLFQIWGNYSGYTLKEAKEIIKGELGYTYVLPGLKYNTVHYCETSGMDSKELTVFIDKFRTWSQANCGYYLCSPKEYLIEKIYFDNLAQEKEL